MKGIIMKLRSAIITFNNVFKNGGFKGRFLVNVDFGPPKLAFEILRTNEITSYLSDLRGDWTK